MMASCLTKIDRCQATRRNGSLIAGPIIAGAADPAAAAATSDESVAGASDRPDVPGAPGVVAQFLPQPADQDVDRPIVGLPVDAAGLVQDALAGQHPPSAPRQEAEESEFRRGQDER